MNHGNAIVLTTGAVDANSKFNIYDLAGNLAEWTIEKTTNASLPCSIRGGYYFNTGSANPVYVRNNQNTTTSYNSIGFRVSLY